MSLIPPPPQTQALSSKTFRPPPLDGSLTLPELYEWHLEHSPEHKLFVFANDKGETRTICWPEAVRAIHVGAKLVKKTLSGAVSSSDTPVVAILSPSDTITYFIMEMAIMRANCIAFPISPRNSAEAVAHLINKTRVTHIFLGREQSMIDLSNDATEILKAQYPLVSQPEVSTIPLFQDLFDQPIADMHDLPVERKKPDEIAIYLHSSGTTAFPKPIPWTNKRFAQHALIPYFGERDLTGMVWSVHSMPMYHGMGVLQLCWTASSGTIMAAFEPKSPAVVPTPDNLFKAAVATHSDVMFCVPAFIEAWSRNPEYVKWLASRTGVLFGGGPLNKTAGDYMTSQGVNIFILYGSTESGIMSPILPISGGYDWEYFRLPGNIAAEMIPNGNNTFEVVMLDGPFSKPSVINTTVKGIEAYNTSDILASHPTKPGYWRVFGRADDQIIHNTGEKTNPGPLENILNQDPHIIASVMFGRGQFHAGVIVDPKPEFKFDPSDEMKLAEFRNKIWPSIQKVNTFAPQHSRLFKEMVMVAKPSKPFQYTAKSTARRQAIINNYAQEIEALYATVDASTQSQIPPPLEWDIVSTTDFVRAVVNKVLIHTVRDHEDIFHHGCDSLQATWIRNSLLRALRDSAQIDTRQSTENFVYNHPTISSLSSYILSLACGVSEASNVADAKANKASAMQAVVDKYTEDLPPHQGKRISEDSNRGVMITGTTGALGCYLLSKLAVDANVAVVYAINRPNKHGQSLRERQEKALLDRGLDPTLVLGSTKVRLVEADLSIPGFGISPELWKEFHLSVTHIIHNAWTVDFNLALSSFEPNIKGLRHLVDFALTSPLQDPPKLMYASSIGVFRDTSQLSTKNPLPEELIPASIAAGSGYTESKWVSERILEMVAKKSVLKPHIVRVGQLCGGLNGSWNTKEWFPSLVHAATVLKCLPSDDRDVSWIPLDLAAQGLLEFLENDFNTSTVTHLIHPRPTSWSSLASGLRQELSVSLVPFSEWLTKLEQFSITSNGHTAGDRQVELLKSIPALRILQFYQSLGAHAADSGRDAFGFPKFSVVNAKALSSSLANPNVPQLGDKDVKAWLGYWRKAGLL